MAIAERAAPPRALAKQAAALAATAAGTAVGVEMTRVFLSYLVFVVDQSQRVTLAAYGFGAFLAAALGILLVSRLGAARAALTAALLLAALRLAVQFSAWPSGRLLLSAGGVAAWGWLMLALLRRDRTAFAGGLVAGLALDLAVVSAGAGVDLPWLPATGADLATLALVALLAGSATGLRGDGGEPGGGPFLLAVGPGVASYLLVSGNLGLAAQRTGFELPVAAALLVVATAMALVALGWIDLATSRLVAAAVIALGIGLLLPRLLPLAQLAVPVLVYEVASQKSGRDSERAAGLWLTGGLLLEAALLFGYYTLTGNLPIAYAGAAGLGLAALAASLRRGLRLRPPAATWRPVTALAILVMITGTSIRLITWSVPYDHAPLMGDVTVMTYNVQSGFDAGSHWDLEATARTIEAAHPDVVLLQEVSRGWLVAGGVDELTWLSRRLQMPYVFGPSSGDGLWGNAVLTRAPVVNVYRKEYTTSQNLKRQATAVRLRTDRGLLTVVVTHLDDPAGAEQTRVQQARELIAATDGWRPAVIGGDFNDDPGGAVPALMRNAGFVDLAGALGPSASTSRDGRRIDYLFATPDVTPIEVSIPDSQASDHRPVVARLWPG